MNTVTSSVVTYLLPLVIPPLVAAARAFVFKRVPSQYIPVILAIGGAVVGAVGHSLGVDVPDLASAGTGAWTGALVSLSSVGIHQLYTQLKAARKAR